MTSAHNINDDFTIFTLGGVKGWECPILKYKVNVKFYRGNKNNSNSVLNHFSCITECSMLLKMKINEFIIILSYTSIEM